MGLLMEKVEEGDDMYRRIGMIRWVHESLFEDVSKTHFTLI